MKSKILLPFIVLLFALASSRLITADTPLDYGSPGNNNPNPQDCGVWLEISDVMRNADDDQNKQSHYDQEQATPPPADKKQHEVLDREHTPSDEDEDDLKSCVITGSAGAMGGTLTLMEIAGQTKYNYKLWKDKNKRVEFTERSWSVAPSSSHYEEFFIEGYEISDQKNDVVMKATMDCPGGFNSYDYYLPAHADKVDKATVWEADLDIDSENQKGVEPPAWGLDTPDDKVEHCEEEGKPGKILVTALNKDSDGDCTPDFADGLGHVPALATQGINSGTCGPDSKLVPVRLDLQQPIEPEKATVKFAYEQNIPRLDEGFTKSGAGLPEDPVIYKLTKAGMRLWAVDAQNRAPTKETGEDVSEGKPVRKFIPAGKDIPWKVLLAAANASAGARSVTIYIEYAEDIGTLAVEGSLAGTREKIMLTETAESVGLAKDLVHVTLITADLDVNAGGDLVDSCDGVAGYLPGYMGQEDMLRAGPAFMERQYRGPQAMKIILPGVGPEIADSATFTILDATDYSGYCTNWLEDNNGSKLEETSKDLSFSANDSSDTIPGTVENDKIWAPIFCKDYGAWCEVEITLMKAGEPVGRPIRLTIPHDGNRDKISDHWQNLQIAAWNKQFTPISPRPLSPAGRDLVAPALDDEEPDPDGAGNGDGGRNLPAMATSGDGLKILAEYRGFILDGGPNAAAGQHKRLSTARKELLVECSVENDLTSSNKNSTGTNQPALHAGFTVAGAMADVSNFYQDGEKGASIDLYWVEDKIVQPGPWVSYAPHPFLGRGAWEWYGDVKYFEAPDMVWAAGIPLRDDLWRFIDRAEHDFKTGFPELRRVNRNTNLGAFVKLMQMTRLGYLKGGLSKDENGQDIVDPSVPQYFSDGAGVAHSEGKSDGSHVCVAAVADEGIGLYRSILNRHFTGNEFAGLTRLVIAHELGHLIHDNHSGTAYGDTIMADIDYVSASGVVRSLTTSQWHPSEIVKINLPARKSITSQP